MNQIVIFLSGLNDTQFNVVFCFAILVIVAFFAGIILTLIEHNKLVPMKNFSHSLLPTIGSTKDMGVRINPATGLPILTGNTDSGGNPNGTIVK